MLIDGRYKTIRPLGEGFSGVVSLVEDINTGAKHALKFLRIEVGAVPAEQLLDRFKQEFSILKKLNHPHIARIGDFGFDPESKQHYFTEEFVDGVSIFEATQDLPAEKIEGLMVQTLRALEFLHSRRIYHFDLKPANLMVEMATFQVKVIDFGLANLPGQLFAGTPTYMAPEICLRQPRDGRADLYAAGVIWYQSLSRANPFAAGNSKETIQRQIHMEPVPICRIRPDLPAYMDIILSRLLAKNPTNRYSRPGMVIRDLNFLGQKSYPIETGETSLGYLPEEEEMIGRSKEWELVEQLMEKAQKGNGNYSVPVVLVSGESGIGKSRFCKETRYLAQLNGVNVTIHDFVGPLSSAELGQMRSEGLHPPEGSKLVLIACYPSDAKALEEWLPLERLYKIPLNPFKSIDIKEYLKKVTGAADIPQGICDAIELRTEGNPRLLRELLSACFARHLFFDSTGRWSPAAFDDLKGEIETLPLPTAMTEWFSTRIQKLPEDAIKVLKIISICENSIPSWGLEEVVGSRLSWGDLLASEGWIDWKEDKVVLHNPSLREWIILRMPREERMKWHDEIANNGERFPEENIGFHIIFGSNLELIEQVISSYVDTLTKEERWGEVVEAISWVWPSFPVSIIKFEIGVQWMSALIELKKHDEVEAVLHRVEAVVERLPESEQLTTRFRLEEEVIEWSIRRQDYSAAEKRIAVLLKEENIILANRIRLQNFMGRISLDQGDLEKADHLLRQTWEEGEKLPVIEKSRILNNDLGLIFLMKGDYPAAVAQFEKELSRIKEVGDRYLEARCYYNLGEAYRCMGEREKSKDYLQKAYDTAQPIGRHELILRILNSMGNLYNELEDGESAIQHYQRAMHLAERLGDRSSSAAIATNLGILLHATAKDADALSYLTHARHLLRGQRTTVEEACLARCLLEIGIIQGEQRDYLAAESTLKEAEKIANSALLPYIQESQKELGIQSSKVSNEPLSKREPFSVLEKKTQIRTAGIGEEEKSVSVVSFNRLLSISKLLTQNIGLSQLLEEILKCSVELTKAEGGAIWLEEKGTLHPEATFQWQMDESSRVLIESLAKKSIHTGESVSTSEASPEENDATRELHADLFLPIRAAGKTIGSLFLSKTIQSQQFEEEDFPLLQAFANHVGLGIERARLLEQVAKHTVMN